LLYILSIVRTDQSLRRWSAGVAVLLLLVAAALLAGCGGSGDSTTGTAATTTSADGAAPPTGDGGSPQASAAGNAGAPKRERHRAGKKALGSAAEEGGASAGKAARKSGSRHRVNEDAEPRHAPDRKSQGADHPAHEPGQSAGATGIEGASPVVVAKLRERCPKGMERAACDDLVESYVAAQNPEAQAAPTPTEPGCPEGLSRAQCEAVLAQQGPGSTQGSAGVNVEECLANMTPQCEELLRASFEAQTQARE
jgi:hypothetical protein